METFIVEHLDKKYGTKCGITDVSFSINENEIFGMVGPNGAGKTTTIECSLGIRKKDSGKVSILGYDPTVSRKNVFLKVGVQLQETSYPGKAKVNELCKLISSLYEKPLPYKRLLKDFQLEEKNKAYISDLSGGQRQRLAIILALLPDPKIVVFDELTTGLDPQARHAMWNHIRSLKNRGITVFLTTHFMEEAQELCDRIAIVMDGRIKTIDTAEHIIASCSLKSQLTVNVEKKDFNLMLALLNKNAYRILDDQISIEYENTHSLLEIIRLLDANTISIKNLSVKTPTLEDAYLALTTSIQTEMK